MAINAWLSNLHYQDTILVMLFHPTFEHLCVTLKSDSTLTVISKTRFL